MSRLFEKYVEGILLKNHALFEQARRNHDEYHQKSTTVTRVMREIIHERVIEMEPDREVMDLVNEHLSKSIKEIAQLPVQVVCPALPETPLLIDFGEGSIVIEEASIAPSGDHATERTVFRWVVNTNVHWSIFDVLRRGTVDAFAVSRLEKNR